MIDKEISLLKKYQKHLEKIHVKMVKADFDAHLSDKKIALEHILSRLPEMENFVREGQKEKFFRWLGFIQGVLWSFGEFSINELRDHNRLLK